MKIPDEEIQEYVNSMGIDKTEFISTDFKEHAKNKAMWGGSIKPIIIPDAYGLNEKDELIELKQHHTPALINAIFEIIINAVDHAKGCEKNIPSKRVNCIKVSFYDRIISVYNNGPGIPLIKDDRTNKYFIELAFTKEYTGTNIKKEKNSIKGGINGLGAKLANIHSEDFTVETVSGKFKYIQNFTDGINNINVPIITKTNEEEHTLITFLLKYNVLGYVTNDMITELNYYIKFRMYQIAAYLGNDVKVYYNDTICNTTNINSLSKLFISDLSDRVIITTCKNTLGHIINLAVIIPTNTKKKNITNIAVINGVLSNKGSHVTYFRSYIKDYLAEQMKKLTKSAEKHNNSINIKLIMIGSIPSIDWSGQCKNELQVHSSILKDYKIPKSFLINLSTSLLGKMVTIENKPKKEDTSKEINKYIPAINVSNPKLRKQCMLLVAEGDSAISLLRSGLTQKCNKEAKSDIFVPSFNWCGIISLQGVIINAAKEIKSIDTDDGNINIKSDRLQNNKRLNMLANAFGLQYKYTYETEKEINTLNYGHLILCVDQDVDGTGKIASLVLVWIHTFWPALLDKKIIGKFMTPLIRAYPKHNTPIVEFYYENELDHKLTEDNNFIKNYKIKYFKGLATHDSVEATSMFKLSAFKQNIYKYYMDTSANRLFEVYFGTDPLLRKQILISPVNHLTYDRSLKLRQSQEIPVGEVQLDIDTKLYKHDAINRQISHVIDGLNPARRKILLGSIIRFSSDSKEVKVFQLGGYIADKMLYHHGDMSLNKTITYMAQNFPGARKYPYLIGVGQFGDRHGSKPGSARYIAVKLNPIVNHIFPPEDRWLLPYTFDEGIRAEPEYFIPILPMSVLESYQIVSEGWNHKSFGRSLESVLVVIYDYIENKNNLIAISENFYNSLDLKLLMPLLSQYTLSIDGDIRKYKNTEYSFGNYVYYTDTNIIHISELPIGVQTNTYIESLSKLKEKYIEKIEDYSSINEIELNIYMKPIITVKYLEDNFGDADIDPIEDLLNLKTSLKPNLNYYSCNRTVLEFDTNYLAAILYWAPVRKNLYKERLVRKRIILQVTIMKITNIIHYIEQSNALNVPSMESEEVAINILQNNKFQKINSGLLHNPGYTKNSELYNLLLYGENASYDYILDLRERDLTKTSLAKQKDLLVKANKELEMTDINLTEKPFAGKTLWKNEIQALLNKLKEKI